MMSDYRFLPSAILFVTLAHPLKADQASFTYSTNQVMKISPSCPSCHPVIFPNENMRIAGWQDGQDGEILVAESYPVKVKGAADQPPQTPALPPTKADAYAQLYSLTTQMPHSGTGSLVRMEVVQLIHNFELAPAKDLLTAHKSGLYYVVLTAQIGTKPPGTNGYVDCWFVKNGKPIRDSNSRQSIESVNFTGLMNTAFILRLEAGDTLGIMLSASGPSLGLLPNRVQSEPALSSVDFLIYKIAG